MQGHLHYHHTVFIMTAAGGNLRIATSTGEKGYQKVHIRLEKKTAATQLPEPAGAPPAPRCCAASLQGTYLPTLQGMTFTLDMPNSAE